MAEYVAVILTTYDLCMADFADELKKARQFGSMTTFGRGLPRGGEMSAVKSLQRQEDILRALHKRDPVVSYVGCLHFKLFLYNEKWQIDEFLYRKWEGVVYAGADLDLQSPCLCFNMCMLVLLVMHIRMYTLSHLGSVCA